MATADYYADVLESARVDIRTSEAVWRKTQRQCAAHFASRLDAVQTKTTRAALRAQVSSTVSNVNEMAHDMTLLHRAFVDLEATGREMGDEATLRNEALARELHLRNERIERENELILAQVNEADTLLVEQRKLSQIASRFCGKCSLTEAWWCGDRCTCAIGILALQLVFFICAIFALVRVLEVF
jgi:hypothetical protein